MFQCFLDNFILGSCQAGKMLCVPFLAHCHLGFRNVRCSLESVSADEPHCKDSKNCVHGCFLFAAFVDTAASRLASINFVSINCDRFSSSVQEVSPSCASAQGSLRPTDVEVFTALFSEFLCAVHGMAVSICVSNFLLAVLMTVIIRSNVTNSCHLACSVHLGYFCISLLSCFSLTIRTCSTVPPAKCHQAWTFFVSLPPADTCPSGGGFFRVLNLANPIQDPDRGRAPSTFQ